MNKLFLSWVACLAFCASRLLALDPVHLTLTNLSGTLESDYWERSFINNQSYPVKLVHRSIYSNPDPWYEENTQTTVLAPNDAFYEYHNAWWDGGDWLSELIILSEEALPARPLLTAADQVTATSLRVNWSSTANAASYRLDVSTAANFSTFVTGFQNLNVGAVTNYSVSGLVDSTTYYYRVRGVNDNGSAGENSLLGSATTAYQVPIVPTFPSTGVITGLTTSSFTLNWNAVPRATEYVVERSTDASFAPASYLYNQSVCTGTSLTYSAPGTIKYFFRVFARNAAGQSPASAVQESVPCAEQIALSATEVGTSRFALTWTPVGASTYRITVSTDSQLAVRLPAYDDVPIGNVCRYMITGLQPSTTYYYRITVVYGHYTTATAIQSVTTGLLQLTLINQNLSLQWNGWTGYDWYKNYRNDTDHSIQVSYSRSLTYSDSNYGTDSTVTLYQRVDAGGSFRESCFTTHYVEEGYDYFEQETITLLTQSPADPYQVPSAPVATAATVANQYLTANWNGVAGVTDYRIDVSTDANFANCLADYTDRSAATNIGIGVFNLQPNTTYYFRVRAHNPAGTSASSNVVAATTTNVVPCVPTLLEADGVLAAGFTLRWNRIFNATGYRLDVALNANFSQLVSPWQNYLIAGGADAESLILTGLTSNQTYYVRIRAENSAGASASSAARMCTPMATPPAAPVIQAVTALPLHNLLLNWNAVSGASGYRLDVSQSPAFLSFLPSKQDLSLGNVTSFTCQQLAPGMTYYFRLRAVNGNLFSNNSVVGSASTTLAGQYLTPTIYSSWSDEYSFGWDQTYENQTSMTIRLVLSCFDGETEGNQTWDVTPGESLSTFDYVENGVTYYRTIVSQTILGAVPVIDQQVPTTPTNLTALAIGPTYATLQWTAATDNVGVIAYWIYRNGSPSPMATVSVPLYNDDMLVPSTTYTYSIRALDAAGNLSAISPQLALTTLANQGIDTDGDGVPDAAEASLATNPATAGQSDANDQLKLQILRPTP